MRACCRWRGSFLHDSLSHLRSVMQVGVLLDHRLDLCSLHSGPSQIHGVFHRFVDLSVQSKLRYQPLSMWAEMFVSVTFLDPQGAAMSQLLVR